VTLAFQRENEGSMTSHHPKAPSDPQEALHHINQSRAAAYAKVASGSWRHDIASVGSP
jgi:hypothetical protein